MKKKSNRKKINIMPNRMLYPIIFALGFIPLIVHMYQYKVGWEDVLWFPLASNAQIDFFHMWKSIAVMAIASLMLVLLVWQYSKTLHLRFEKPYFLLLAYAFFVTLSAVLSPYKPQVYSGSFEVLQPFGVMLGYMMLCYYTYCLVETEQQLSAVLRYSTVGVAIMVTIGIFQYAGMDPFRTIPGRFLISDPEFWDRLDQISFTFGKRRVYATLYNPDFLSFYFGMIIPVLIAMALATRKKIVKIILLILCILSVVCVIGADTSAGYLAIVIALVVAAFILLSRKRKTLYLGLAAAGAALVLVCLLCILTPLGAKTKALFLGTRRSIDTQVLKSMETKDDGVYLNINGKILAVSYTFESNVLDVAFRDEAGNPIRSDLIPSEDGNHYFKPADDSYADLIVKPVSVDGILCICVHLDEHDWYFSGQSGRGYYYYNPSGRFEKVSEINTIYLFRDDAFSGRGIIWNRIFPILPKYMIIGSGSNTFARAYPQNDYVYKTYRGGKSLYSITVKAHNWFLQEWIENGFTGMICIFGFYLWYFIRSVRLYRRCDMRQPAAILGFGILTGTIGYVAAGISSDANVCTAPVFWVMMGLGMATNRMLSEKSHKL